MRGGLERLLQFYACLVYAFMYAPILLMGLFSLNSTRYMTFPLEDFTFAWYGQVMSDTRILGGLLTTFMVAIPVTLITTVLGAMAALALTRHDFHFKAVYVGLLVLPFFIPKIIFAVAQVTFLGEAGIAKSLATVWVAQSVIVLPFTTVIIGSVLFRVDRRLEEVAADLGATGWQTFRLVILPLIKNGVMAAAFVSFVLSSAEYTVSFFTSGRIQPLSVLVASDFRFNLSPSLNALAMLIVLFNVVIVVLSEILRRRAGRRRASALAAGA